MPPSGGEPLQVRAANADHRVDRVNPWPMRSAHPRVIQGRSRGWHVVPEVRWLTQPDRLRIVSLVAKRTSTSQRLVYAAGASRRAETGMGVQNSDADDCMLTADARWEVIAVVVGLGGVAFFAYVSAASTVDNIWIRAALLVPALPYVAVLGANFVRQMRVSDDGVIALVRKRGVVLIPLSDVTSIERRVGIFSPKQTVVLKAGRRTYRLYLADDEDSNGFRDRVTLLHPRLSLVGW